MDAFPILLTPLEIVFYNLDYQEFEQIFEKHPKEDV